MEIIGPLAMNEPIPIDEVYSRLISNKDKYNIDISYGEFLEILNDLEKRGAIKIVKKDSNTYIVLTEDAKYFLIVYSPAWIGL